MKGRAEIREELGVGPEDPVVVVTVGGYPEAMPFLHRLSDHPDITFLVTGAHETQREGRIHLFDNGTHLYMPHLVRAADAVVAKLGYSTVAEVWREGRPLATVTREDFREMEPLQSWVEARLPGFRIPAADFAGGAWLDRIPQLLARQRPPTQPEGGADQVVTGMEEHGLLSGGVT